MATANVNLLFKRHFLQLRSNMTSKRQERVHNEGTLETLIGWIFFSFPSSFYCDVSPVFTVTLIKSEQIIFFKLPVWLFLSLEEECAATVVAVDTQEIALYSPLVRRRGRR